MLIKLMKCSRGAGREVAAPSDRVAPAGGSAPWGQAGGAPPPPPVRKPPQTPRYHIAVIRHT